MKAGPRQDLARRRASTYRIESSLDLVLRVPRAADGIVARKRHHILVTYPRPCTRYFGWSRNRRRSTVPCHLRGRPSEFSYCRNELILFLLRIFAEPLITLVVFVRHCSFTRRATTLPFA